MLEWNDMSTLDDIQQEKFTFLDNLYHNVKSPASFSSVKKLLKAARDNFRLDITLNDVKDYLRTQPSYTKHGMVPRTFRKKYCPSSFTRKTSQF